MESSKKYYKNINLIRVIACLGVLLYHFNILKGGYLAVCIFFVLSGYLSCISAFKKEKFSLIKYYSNRLSKIYLPLLIVVFISVFVVSLFPDINWLNLKPETTSVLLGYNNFWQLSANMDYFARHINSPFIHLWYISILLQFDLIFPFIYIPLRKLGDKTNKLIPCIITVLFGVIASIYFYKMNLEQTMMVTYYNTFTRIFSLLFGLSLGFIKSYYDSLIPKNLKKQLSSKIIFYTYLLILLTLFILVDVNSKYYAFSMILTSIITMRLIDYATINTSVLNLFDKIIKSLSDISYEVYLFQYPIIFLFQYIIINKYFKLPLMIALILLLSYILHFSINNKNPKLKILKYITSIIVISISLYGGYLYIKAKDYTEEMKALEQQLSQNQEILNQKKEEYTEKLKQEQDEWVQVLNDLETGEVKLKETVKNLSIVGVGDSVMLGAVNTLYAYFPNSYIDAQISRTAWVVNDILLNLKYKNMLGNVVVLNLGANGDCADWCKKEIMNTLENRKVFWINTTNDIYVNNNLVSFASNYDNLYIIDWYTISRGHYDYFFADGIHLTETGKYAYTNSIYEAIYNVYLDGYNKKKQDIINEYDEKQKTKISFYGNDILLNAFEYIQLEFEDAKFNIKNELSFDALKQEIKTAKENDLLTYKIVFAFDSSVSLSLDEYKELIELCNDNEIYILLTKENRQLLNTNYENVTFIKFFEEIEDNSNYLMPDKIHLTNEGNKALKEMLENSIIHTKNNP